MAGFNCDDDIFSPVRFDSSLADSSVNSGGSITSALNFDLELSRKDSPINKCDFEFSDVKKKESKQESASSSDCLRNSLKSKVSVSSLTTSKNSLTNSTNSKKLSTDSVTLSLDKKRLSKNKNISTKEDSAEVLKSQHKRRISKEKEITEDSSGKNQLKEKRPVRPTTLLVSGNKVSESSVPRDIKKRENGIKEKISSSKYREKDKVQKRNSADSTERDSLKNKNVLDIKKTSALKPGDDSGKRPHVKDKINNDLENNKAKELTQSSGDARFTPNPLLQSEHEVIEKIVCDHMSFECDKIRQNIYTQQMSFYKQINKTKEELETRNLETSERLLKVIEELAQINGFLKENS